MMLALSIVAAFALLLACSSGGDDLPKQISGTWQRSGGNGTIEIDLVKTPVVLKVDGQAYSASIAKVDNGVHSVHLSVQNGSGQPEEWILRQVWNDNGSDFTLAFIHNGAHEKLVSMKQSS
jgi:hypothetical protein